MSQYFHRTKENSGSRDAQKQIHLSKKINVASMPDSIRETIISQTRISILFYCIAVILVLTHRREGDIRLFWLVSWRTIDFLFKSILYQSMNSVLNWTADFRLFELNNSILFENSPNYIISSLHNAWNYDYCFDTWFVHDFFISQQGLDMKNAFLCQTSVFVF